jgi:hypothetical protein
VVPDRGSVCGVPATAAAARWLPLSGVRWRQCLSHDVSTSSLAGFVRDVVRPGSVVRTDGWNGDDGLSKAGYQRQAINVAASGRPAHVVMPAVHRIASLLKRWLLGTHQGAVTARHLDYYLDEYTFRFNRRSAKARGLLFYRLVEQAVLTEPLTYRGIVGGKNRLDHNA